MLLVFLVAGFRFVDYLYQDADIDIIQGEVTKGEVKGAVDEVIGEAININQATASQLQKLNGIGEIKARAIIDYRQEYGDFTSKEDLINVDGIGPATYDQICELICVE